MAKKDASAPIEGIEIRHRNGCKAKNLGPGCTCSAGVRTTSPRKEAFNGSDALADRVEAARRWRIDALRMVKSGIPLEPTHRVTFYMAVDEWLANKERVKQVEYSTLMEYRRLAPIFKKAFGDVLVHAITPQHVEAWRDKLAEDGAAGKTVNRQLVLLGGVFLRMKGKWNIDHNPSAAAVVQRLSEKKANAGALQFYSPEQVAALVRHGGHYADLYLTAAMTGLRYGELAALRFRDVDLVGSRILVQASYCRVKSGEKAPKSGHLRSVPLADEVAQVIARREGSGDDLVFTHDVDSVGENRISYERVRTSYVKAQRAAGLPRIRFHDLRHTFGTTMAAAGVPLTTIQAWMGHADVKTTMIYAHYAPKRDEAKLVSAAFAVEQPEPLGVHQAA